MWAESTPARAHRAGADRSAAAARLCWHPSVLRDRARAAAPPASCGSDRHRPLGLLHSPGRGTPGELVQYLTRFRPSLLDQLVQIAEVPGSDRARAQPVSAREARVLRGSAAGRPRCPRPEQGAVAPSPAAARPPPAGRHPQQSALSHRLGQCGQCLQQIDTELVQPVDSPRSRRVGGSASCQLTGVGRDRRRQVGPVQEQRRRGQRRPSRVMPRRGYVGGPARYCSSLQRYGPTPSDHDPQPNS